MRTAAIDPIEPTDIDGIRVRVAHVKSLGVLGGFLALLTMAAAVLVGLAMLFGRALVAAAVVSVLWPYIFNPEFTQWVFGSNAAPFWKVFLLMVVVGSLGRMLFRGK